MVGGSTSSRPGKMRRVKGSDGVERERERNDDNRDERCEYLSRRVLINPQNFLKLLIRP